MPIGITLWQVLKKFNLFRLVERKTMEMFSTRARNKSKYTIVTTKFYETLEGKVIFKGTLM